MSFELYQGSMYLLQPLGRDLEIYYRVKKVIYVGRSKYQDIAIVELAIFGKTLILDGLIQSTEADEYIYHEALVHPSLILHEHPRRVLILGGGEGATLREVLKHDIVDEVVMVDIDEQVIEVSKKYLEEWHQGSFNNPKARIVIDDAFAYVTKALRSGEKYDVVIMDLTDPYGPDIAKHLYSEEFLRKVKGILRDEKGIVVTQAGNSFFYKDYYKRLVDNYKKVFARVWEYGVWIPSFMYVNNFVLASDNASIIVDDAKLIEKRLSERKVKTRFYNPSTHIAMFLSVSS
ncbi:MAG: polyamine aminopropyltransferase [Pyrodictiaceae archaeon]